MGLISGVTSEVAINMEQRREQGREGGVWEVNEAHRDMHLVMHLVTGGSKQYQQLAARYNVRKYEDRVLSLISVPNVVDDVQRNGCTTSLLLYR